MNIYWTKEKTLDHTYWTDIGQMRISGRVTFVEEFGRGDGVSANRQQGGGLFCIFFPVDGDHHPSGLRAQNQRCLFLSLYI